MIFYYSGTGNSAYAAHSLSEMIGEDSVLINMAPVAISKFQTPDSLHTEMVGFVFPIYSWGIPPLVLKYISELPAELLRDKYIWAVCTCGDEAGVAMKKLSRFVNKIAGKPIDAMYSLIMPNNYVLLPGFSVDTAEVAESKLQHAPERISVIASQIKHRLTGVNDVHTGSMPALRSMVWLLFVRWGINPKKWHASDACIGCGKCAKVCPCANITYDDASRPVWGNECASCCACFHVCPTRAIDYGSITKDKKQYLFPGYRGQ